jgi:hypothetical protein
MISTEDIVAVSIPRKQWLKSQIVLPQAVNSDSQASWRLDVSFQPTVKDFDEDEQLPGAGEQAWARGGRRGRRAPRR